MTTLTETVFLGHDNSIRLLLLEDCVPFATQYPTVTPDRFVLRLGDWTLDSEDYPAAFTWNAADSTLEIGLGPVVTQECAPIRAALTVYAAPWPHGIVWTHPTSTPDILQIRIVA